MHNNIHANKPLRKGEKRAFKLIIKMQANPETPPLPFSQKLIDDFYPNGLTMRVVLPSVPRQFCKEIFFSARAEVNAGIEEMDKPLETIITWPIKRPRIGRRYRISWES